MPHHLPARAIPAVIDGSTTLSAVTLSTPTSIQQPTSLTGIDNILTFQPSTLPDPNPTSIHPSQQPIVPETTTTSNSPVILDEPYIANVAADGARGGELRREVSAAAASASSSTMSMSMSILGSALTPSVTMGTAAPSFSAACVDPAVCCISADQCKQNSGPFTATTSTRNAAGGMSEQSLAWPVMAVAGVLMALGF